MNFSYYNPVDIRFDVSYIDILKDIDFKNALIVTSKGFKKRGIIKKMQDIFKNKINYVFDEISPNPELSFLQNIKKDLPNFDCIIAIGGGSVLDSAKFLSLKNEIMAKNGALEIIGNVESKSIYAIPTTAGTSSELTKWATIWDKDSNIKYSLNHNLLYPKIAIYDINLMQSIPKDITISTGLDVLSHAVESIWNINANPISTNNAIKAIDLILQNLALLSCNLDSRDLRENLALACIYAGFAFSNTQTALAHAISYPITMRFGIPHGIACSFSIPLLLDCIPKGESCSLLLQYKDRIKNLFYDLEISQDLKDYGLDSKFINEIFVSLNQRAKNSIFDINFVKERFLENI